jgi:hypothetical protein
MADYAATGHSLGGYGYGYSLEEAAYYRGMADYASAVGEDYTAYGAAMTSPEENAYYQGVADYAAAMATDTTGYGSYSYSPEEVAYYQGMADYAAEGAFSPSL